MMRLLGVTAVGVLAATVGMANFLSNGSFENGSFTNFGGGGMSVGAGSSAIQGLTITGSADIAWILNGNAFGLAAQNGNGFLDLTGYTNAAPYDAVSQTVSLAAGNYKLSFYLGDNGSNAMYTGPVAVLVSAGDQSHVSFTNSSTAPGDNWILETLNFHSNGSPTVITIQGSLSTGSQYIGLDDVDLESASQGLQASAPEPSMALPFLLVIGGLLGWRMRKSSSSFSSTRASVRL